MNSIIRGRKGIRMVLVTKLWFWVVIETVLLLVILHLGRCNVVDESLYSRQLYVMGVPAQQRLSASNVVIVGLGGVGVELAKNVILAGPRSVTIVDLIPSKVSDLSTQFYLDEDSIGKSRAAESFAWLRDLNPLVQLHLVEPADESVDSLGKALQENGVDVDVLVAADCDCERQAALNKLARKLKASFVGAHAPGVFGSIFCDFGDEFTVHDVDSRECKTGIIKAVEQKEGETVITLVDGEKHDLAKTDRVLFEAAEGEEETCLQEDSFPVRRIINPTTFTVASTPALNRKFNGGKFRQVKEPLQMSFKPMSEARKEMASIPTDFGKASVGRQLTLHACFESLARFKKDSGRLPKPGNVKDAEKFKKLVKNWKFLEEVKKARNPKTPPVLDEKVIEIFSRTCQGSLAPVCSFIGGVAAQEVLKACTGTFIPLNQYLFFDAVEALPNTLPAEKDCAARNDRYDGQRAVLGNELQSLIQDQAIFIIGAGAIGCELLKNMALMGVGQITVTDNDTIERSNLNRQFLFREKDLGSPKSEAAANAAMQINPDISVIPLTKKVGRETEVFFNDDFWFNQDVIANALDNVEARLYVDGRCVYYRKPLLESGTEGTSGNVQIVVPFLTESYGSSVDPPEASIPVCTLKSFPYQIEHCIQWARDFFDGFFRIQPERLNDLLSRLHIANNETAAAVLSELRSQNSDETILRDLQSMLVDLEIWDPLPSARRCVEWAIGRFYELFNSNIRHLLKEHPLDSKTEDGEPFWSADRRIPKPIEFDRENELHIGFLLTASFLKARVFHVIERTSTIDEMRPIVISVLDEILKDYQTPDYVSPPEEELEANIQRQFEEVRRAIRRIMDRKGKFCSLPEVFEKDQDDNGHVDFITSASNLRATNYDIMPADRLQTKKIAGRIIPAIATTTSVVAGLASLELCKLAQREDGTLLQEEDAEQMDRFGSKPLQAYRNAFVNLAGPLFALTEPMEAPPIAIGENGHVYNIWDRLDLIPKKELTLRGLLDYALEHFSLQITSMTIHGSKIIYADFMHGEDDPVFDRTISDLVEVEEDRYFVDLEVECADEEGNELESPPIRYYFPQKRGEKRNVREVAKKLWGTLIKTISK